jgi:hypothetical protein
MEVMYRITFGIIANYIQAVNAEHNSRIISPQQKGFIKKVEGCSEHISKNSLLLAHAITNKKPICIAAIDCKDAFGSVTHDILEQNLRRTGLPTCLVNVIMDSYKDTYVRIWNQGEASNPIPILKGVKQGCPLSPLLFNICIDPIFSFIMRQENHKYAYQTEQFPCNLIQAHEDDTLVIANLAEGLQKLIDDADTFFKFVNTKLNPKKCEIFRTNSKTNQIIKIAGEAKEYVSELEYVKYLGVPLG